MKFLRRRQAVQPVSNEISPADRLVILAEGNMVLARDLQRLVRELRAQSAEGKTA